MGSACAACVGSASLKYRAQQGRPKRPRNLIGDVAQFRKQKRNDEIWAQEHSAEAIGRKKSENRRHSFLNERRKDAENTEATFRSRHLLEEGDWLCHGCKHKNIHNRTQCLRCDMLRPSRESDVPGEASGNNAHASTPGVRGSRHGEHLEETDLDDFSYLDGTRGSSSNLQLSCTAVNSWKTHPSQHHHGAAREPHGQGLPGLVSTRDVEQSYQRCRGIPKGQREHQYESHAHHRRGQLHERKHCHGQHGSGHRKSHGLSTHTHKLGGGRNQLLATDSGTHERALL